MNTEDFHSIKIGCDDIRCQLDAVESDIEFCRKYMIGETDAAWVKSLTIRRDDLVKRYAHIRKQWWALSDAL